MHNTKLVLNYVLYIKTLSCHVWMINMHMYVITVAAALFLPVWSYVAHASNNIMNSGREWNPSDPRVGVAVNSFALNHIAQNFNQREI